MPESLNSGILLDFILERLYYFIRVTSGARDKNLIVAVPHLNAASLQGIFMSKPTTQVAIVEYRAEFPFLENVGLFDSVRVERLDLNTLGLKPVNITELSLPWFCFIFLVDKKKAIIKRLRDDTAVRKTRFNIFRPSTWFKEIIPAETVESAISSLGPKISDLGYVVVNDTCKVVIYKVPPGLSSLQKWIDEEKARIQQETQTYIQLKIRD